MKKVFAVAATVGLLGATMVGALADLGNYPEPFINDGAFNGAIVVGANAKTTDVLGAIDIAASLQAHAKTGVAIAGGAVAVEGGEMLDTYGLNELIAVNVTESEVAGLLDDRIRWNSADYDVYEEIQVDNLAVATYHPNATALGDDEFGSEPYLTVQGPGISYMYVFDEAINGTSATEGFAERPLEIKFLGKTLKITAIEDGEMTVEASSEYYMEEGDTVEVDGKTIELRKVGTSSVLVTVDGQTKAIGDDVVEFENADYFEVELVSMFYIEGATDNSATLRLGDELVSVVQDDDSLEIFGEPSEEDEAEWVWEISVTAPNDIAQGNYIAAVQSMARTLVEIEDEDEERPALAMGEPLEFPNNYASIEFVGWEDADQNMYDDLIIKPGYSRIDGNYEYYMELSSTNDGKVFYVYDDATVVKKTNKVYFTDGGAVFDADKNEVVIGGTVTFGLNLAKEEVDIDPTTWTITAGTETFVLDVDGSFEFFGAIEKEAEDAEVLFQAVPIGENDETFRTDYGIIVEDMESLMDKDEFRISVPHAEQKPVVVIKGKGTSVGVSESGMSYNVNPIALGLGMLDTDANLGSKPMIVVGGPYVNTVAAELLGNPTPEEIEATFTQGKAMIKWFDAKQAMLVAGYEAIDTQGAAYVVARHTMYDFEGEELEVVVTSLNNIKVNTV